MIQLCFEYLSVRCIWLYLLVMLRTCFRLNPHSIVCLIIKELLAQSRHEIWSLSDWNWIRTQNHLICKRTLNHLTKLAKRLSCVLSTYLYGAFDCIFLSCHVRVSEWIHLQSCLNVKDLLARSRRKIGSFSDCNWTPTQNYLAGKRTLKHLAKLAFDCAFDCIFLSCYLLVSEWIHTP